MSQTHGPKALYELARGAGFTPDQSVAMAAIALAESGGNTNAVGDQSLANSIWGPSIGLWQVRSLRAHSGTGKERDATRLTDPSFNARSARIIYGQQGLRAWTVFTTGAFAKYLDDVEAAVRKPDGGLIPGVPDVADLPGVNKPGDVIDLVGDTAAKVGGGALSGLDAIGNVFGALGERGTWVRVLQVVGGAGLVVGGLLIVGKDIAAPAVSAIADVLPAGKAAKAAAGVAAAAK